MKQLSVIAILLIALVSLTGCENENVKKLRHEIAVANASCPISYGIGGDLLSVKYQEKENNVLLYYSINEEYASHIFLKNNRDNMMKQFRLMLADREAQEMLKVIVNANAGITVILKTPSTGKTVKFSLSNEDLKEIENTPLSDMEIKRQALENKVAIENAGCPTKQDEGMSMTKVALVDDNLVYYCEIDEELVNFKEMKKSQSEMKDGIREYLIQSRRDPTMQKELQLITSLGMGFQYRYYGSKSKDYVDVIFTPEELSEYILR